MMHLSTLIPLSVLILGARAKTDIGGCVSTEVPYMTQAGLVYRSLLWYVPDTGELCEFLDCGGGRAPPKTNVPGCGNYKGTDTYSPKYWTGFQAAATTAAAEAEQTTSAGNAVASTTSAAAGGAQSTGPAKSSTFTTVTGSGTVTKTESAQGTAAPTSSGAAEASEGSSSSSSSSTSSATGVSTAGAAPTGVRIMGVMAGVAAAGLALAA
ncbi:hypothetical protein QBC42DRAFT_268931 [Cladorrhinum samala]|uniref:Siderophore biosynthesis enzyme n=1 Tax=Cladorrhinum samala TaxID=585594 RepID=A0AAV9HQX2_9PEZI|nr:hypothetical protein QBC42DRAFT_268931 [Cladorrhinum samala]